MNRTHGAIGYGQRRRDSRTNNSLISIRNSQKKLKTGEKRKPAMLQIDAFGQVVPSAISVKNQNLFSPVGHIVGTEQLTTKNA
jgi:hypothetical protein